MCFKKTLILTFPSLLYFFTLYWFLYSVFMSFLFGISFLFSSLNFIFFLSLSLHFVSTFSFPHIFMQHLFNEYIILHIYLFFHHVLSLIFLVTIEATILSPCL
ncbi:hypothetical protein BS78_04G008300 [Paspalum vaginatum]|nr:hypothetical protein BS78_04G008300 [Paspalum vaginatum]